MFELRQTWKILNSSFKHSEKMTPQTQKLFTETSCLKKMWSREFIKRNIKLNGKQSLPNNYYVSVTSPLSPFNTHSYRNVKLIPPWNFPSWFVRHLFFFQVCFSVAVWLDVSYFHCESLVFKSWFNLKKDF